MVCIESRESVATLSEIDHWTLHNNYTKHQCLRWSSGQGAILYVGFWQTKRNIITIILSSVSLIYLDACNWLIVQCVCMRTYSWHSIRQGSYMNILVHCLKHRFCLCEKWQFCFEGHTLKSVIWNTIRSKLHSKMIHTMWNN